MTAKRNEKTRSKLTDILVGEPARREKVGTKRLTTDTKHADDMIKLMRKASLLGWVNITVTFILLGGTFADMVLFLFVPIDLLTSAICTLFMFQVPSFSRVYRMICRPLDRWLCFFVGREEYKLVQLRHKADKENKQRIETYMHTKKNSMTLSLAPPVHGGVLKGQVGDRNAEEKNKPIGQHPKSHTNSINSQPFLSLINEKK